MISGPAKQIRVDGNELYVRTSQYDQFPGLPSRSKQAHVDGNKAVLRGEQVNFLLCSSESSKVG